MIDWTLVTPLVLITILVALMFDFYNGLHDAANSIATVVSTRALPVWAALLLASTFNFVGAFSGTAVAATVGSGIIAKDVLDVHVVLAGLIGAIAWSMLTVVLGIPISSSQALIGGLIGSALAKAGLAGVQMPHWGRYVDSKGVLHAAGDVLPVLDVLAIGALAGLVVGLTVGAVTRSRMVTSGIVGLTVGSSAWLVVGIFHGLYIQKLLGTLLFIAYSPFIGFVMAFAFTAAIAWGVHRLPQGKVKHFFRWMQVLSSSFYSFSHGSNDAQKTMGVITAVLLFTGAVAKPASGEFLVPFEVIVACGIAIALGTLIGGYKIVRTMGTRLTHLDTSQGFAAETSSALGLYYLAHFGVPVSTTHSITGSILGVGAFQRISAVSWGVARRIVMAWIVTIPAAAAVGAVCYVLFSRIG